MNRRTTVCAWIILFFTSVALRADTPALTGQQAAALDAAVKAEMEKQQAVGAAVGVIQHDQIIYLKGYGFADREKEIPVSDKTLFRWASVSKPLTAIAAMQLFEKGLLDLDANVRTYVPEFPDKGKPITVRQLLCHQSGIVHYQNGQVIVTEKTYTTPHPFEDVVVALDRFKESPLLHTPGEKFSYSTHGYILMSAVVERAGKQRYVDQIRERIVVPLGMTTLQPDYQWKDIPNRATGYRKENGQVVRSTDTDVSWKLGGGGFLSNIGDMAKFAQALLQHKLVSGPTEKLMFTPQKTADGKPTNMALGFSVDKAGGKLRVLHGGSQEKTRTRMVIYPAEHEGVVVMLNGEHTDPAKFVTAIEQALQSK